MPTSKRVLKFLHRCLIRGILHVFIVYVCVVAAYGAETPAVENTEQVQRVRSIRIEVREIFDESDLGFFYRTLNALKVSTREEVVRRELLFKEGDVFDPFLIEESERNLRSLPFLRRVSITPVHDGEYVDLLVSVQDTWTLYPFLSFSSGGGTSKQAIGLTEGNLLGYGKRLEVLYADDEGRDKIEAVWDDRRVLNTYNRLTVGHFQRSDGPRSVGSLGRPFRSLTDPYAWSINGDYFDLVGKLWEAGDERFIYRQRHSFVAGGYTWSRGDPEVLVRRYTLGYDYTRDDFKMADEDDFEDVDVDPESVSRDPALLADDRRFSGPLVSFQQLEPDFLSINFVDRFDRVEDFNLGHDINLSFHMAPEALDSLRDTLLVKTSASDGWRTTATSFLRGELGGSFRADEDGANNILVSLQLKYFNILGSKFLGDIYIGKHTLATSLTADHGEKLDKDIELLLGASNGLRGYEDRTFAGDQRLIVNLEDRFHIVEDVYRLVSIGGAVFLDAGGTSRNGIGDIIKDRLYADVGFGLRLGLTRSSGGAVLRLDVAYPLRDGPDGSSRFEPRVLLSSGQAFSARLRSESLRSQAARISAGFIP